MASSSFPSSSIILFAFAHSQMLLTSLNKRDAVHDFLKIVWNTTLDPAFAKTQVGGFSDHLHSLGESLDDDSDGDSPAPRPTLSKRGSGEMKLNASNSSNPLDIPQKKDAEHEHDSLDHVDNDGIQGASAPSSAVEAERADPVFTRSEKIFRSRSQIHHQDSAKSVAMPPTTTSTSSPNIEAAPSSNSSSRASFSHDKHKVITLAKQKSKKLDKEDKHEKDNKEKFVVTEEPLISQRLLMNEIFHEEAQTVYTYLFHTPNSIKCSRRNDVQRGEWEKREGGLRVREGTFTDTVKLPPKDSGKDSGKDRYVLAKFKEVQQILSEDKGHFLVNTDITCADPEVHEDVAITIATTISSENVGRCRMTMSCQLKFPKAQIPKELVDRVFESIDVFCREVTTQLNLRYVAPEKLPANPASTVSPGSSATSSSSSSSSKLAWLQDKYVISFAVVAVVLFILALFLWWYLSPVAPTLTDEEIRWLSFIRKTRTEPISAEDSITVLFDQYKTKVIGGAQHNVEESVSALYEKLGKLRSHYVV